MPNTKSAIKAARQNIRRRARNIAKKDAFKKAVKEVRKLIAAGKKRGRASHANSYENLGQSRQTAGDPQKQIFAFKVQVKQGPQQIKFVPPFGSKGGRIFYSQGFRDVAGLALFMEKPIGRRINQPGSANGQIMKKFLKIFHSRELNFSPSIIAQTNAGRLNSQPA